MMKAALIFITFAWMPSPTAVTYMPAPDPMAVAPCPWRPIAGVRVPLVESLITLVSVMTGADFRKRVVTPDYLDVGLMDRAELNLYL
jgi:hypothetical protein